MHEFDLFDLYRLLLLFAAGVYCIISTAWRLIDTVRSVHSMAYADLVWKYLVVQMLRVRLRDTGRELAYIALLLGVLGTLAWLHTLIIPGTSP